jgi:monoamine oxidase
MARTPLFRALKRLFSIAQVKRRHNLSHAHVQDLLGESREKLLTRREMLLGAASLAAIPNRSFGILERGIYQNAPRIVVVGAGIAGLTSAWELCKRGSKCRIYEASQRVGGRMWTQPNFNAFGMYAEYGAEFIDPGQSEIHDLMAELNRENEEPLGHVDLWTFKDQLNGIAEEDYFVEGATIPEDKVLQLLDDFVTAMGETLFWLEPHGKFIIPNCNNKGSFGMYEKDVEELEAKSLATFMNEMSDRVDRRIVKLLKNCFIGEMGCELDKQAALNLIGLLGAAPPGNCKIYGTSDESQTIKGGVQRLPIRLEHRLKKDYDVQINYGHRLVAIAKRGLHTFELYFAGHPKPVRADKVILALPFATLRLVNGIEQLGLSQKKLQSILYCQIGTNSRAMVGFTERVWERGPNGRSSGKIFCDDSLRSHGYWDGARAQREKGPAGIMTSYLGGNWGKKVPPGIERTIIEDMAKLYSFEKEREIRNSFQEHVTVPWITNQFALGAYTCPAPNQYFQFIGSEATPELNNTFALASETADLEHQGFMNGAVRSGIKAAAALA